MQSDYIGTSPFCSIRQHVSTLRERNYLVFIWFWLLWVFDGSVYHRSDTLYHRDLSLEAQGYMDLKCHIFWWMTPCRQSVISVLEVSVNLSYAWSATDPQLRECWPKSRIWPGYMMAELGTWERTGSTKHCDDVPILSLVILHHNFTTKFRRHQHGQWQKK